MSLAAHESSSYEKLVPKSEGKVDDQNLVVGLRLRPMNEDEIIAGATPVAHKVDDNMVVLMDPTDDPDDILRSKRSREKQYIFDVTFDGSSSQRDVYEKTTKSLIPSVVNGYNATVFAYGATGAGKTYTMLGTAEERGIMARTLNDLFQEMENTREDMAYRVTVSFLEIYNEMIRDLLNPSSGYLELREDNKGVQVAGLSKFQAKSSREVMSILLKGNKERTQEPTAANKTSSRSHAILQITVRQKNRVRDSTSGEVRLGKLFLIDLAGSERAANTQNRGKRMVEGAHINRSLLALGNCINALSDKNGHRYVNYRDSKLTRLLKDALGGNCKTVMIATISPASLHFEESRNTLVYADRAKSIKTKVRRNVMDVSYHIAQYSNIIAELREEIKRLRTKLDQKATRTSAIHTVKSALSETQSVDVQKLKEQLIEVFNNQMRLRRNLMELDNHTMEIGLEETRNTLLIQKWEREKAVTARRHREGDADINQYKDREKQQELEGLGPEMPEEVVQAREELLGLQMDEERTQRRKESILKELEISKGRAAKIEEMLPSLSSTQDQQEVLRLLCKIHELEMENVQMQSSCIVRNMEIRQQEMTIAQYKQRHHLADELIQQQRILIDSNDVAVPKELDELYELYMQQAAGLVEVHLPDIYAHKNMTMMSLNQRVPETETNSDADDAASAVHLPKIFVPYNGANSIARKQLLKKSSLHLNKLEEKETFFAKSPRAMQLDNSGLHTGVKGSKSTATLSPTPPTLHDNGLRQKSILTLSSRSTGTTPTPPGDSDVMKTTHDSLDRTLIATKTRNIAALAARRKNKAHVDSFNVAEKQSATDSSFFVTQNADHKATSDGYLTQSRLAQHNRRYDSPATLDNLNVDDTVSNATELHQADPSRKKRSLYRNELVKKSPYAASTQQRAKAANRDQNLANYQQMTPEEFFKQLSRGPPRKQPDPQTSSSSVHSEVKPRSKVPQPRGYGRKSKQSDREPAHGGSTNRTSVTTSNVNNSTSPNKATKKPLPTIPIYRKGDISITGQSLQR